MGPEHAPVQNDPDLAPPQAATSTAAPMPGSHEAVLLLQRSAGNSAVFRMLSGRPPEADPPPGGAPAGVDAHAEVAREEPAVQAPTAADVTEQPPAALIAQQGGAALQSLEQAATVTPAPPAAEPLQPEPLPPPDMAGAMTVETAGVATEAIAQRDAAASTATQSAATLDGLRSVAGQMAPVEYGGGPDAAAASGIMTGFLANVGARAAEVTDLGASAAGRYQTAAAATTERIAAAVQERTQAIAAHIAQLKTDAQSEADAAREHIAAQYAAARAAITASTTTTRELLQAEHTSALQAIDTRETAQLQVIEQRYQAGDQRFRAAGTTVGNEAVQRGNQMAGDYMRGLVDEDDSFLDGPLTYNRGKARADTAREISKAYQSGLVEEANKQADQAMLGKARDIESAHTTATHARESLQRQLTATLTVIAQAETTALQQAMNASVSLTDSVTQALRGGQQTLDQLEVSLNENLRTAAQAQSASVGEQANLLTAATQDQISAAVAGLLNVGSVVSAQVQGARAPQADQLASSIADATSQLDSGVAAIRAQIEQGQALGEQELANAAQAVANGLTTSVQTGLDGATTTTGDVAGTIQEIAGSATRTFQTIRDNHDTTLAETSTAAVGGFAEAVSGVGRAYDEMSRGLEQGFAQSAAGLEQGLRGALPKMEQEIRTKAEENAAAVPPRWKSVVKWILIIAVVVVVALVIGPFVIGAVGAALGTGAVMTGIIAGAIVGAATGATIQVINNWASNRPLGEGVLRAAIVGAIGGAVGGGFGAYFTSAAQAGTTIVNTAFRQFLANTAINVVTETALNIVTTGHFSWEALGMSLLSAIAVGGAMHAAGGLKGVQGIQEGSMAAGEGFGGAIRTGLGGTVSINYRPTATTSQTGDENTGGNTSQQSEEGTGTGTGTQQTEEGTGTGTGTQQTEEGTGTGTGTQQSEEGTGTGGGTRQSEEGTGTGSQQSEEGSGTGGGTRQSGEPESTSGGTPQPDEHTSTNTTQQGEEGPANTRTPQSEENAGQTTRPPVEEPPLTPEQIARMSNEDALAEIARRVPDPEQRARLLEQITRPQTLLKYLARGTSADAIEAGLAEVARSGIPQGFTEDQFVEMSAEVRAAAGQYGDDIRVQGSRAAGVSQPKGDIDIAILVDEARFNEIVTECFGTPKPGTAAERTMLHAIRSGKIQRGELGLSGFGKRLSAKYGLGDSDISVVRRGGPTDNGQMVPLR